MQNNKRVAEEQVNSRNVMPRNNPVGELDDDDDVVHEALGNIRTRLTRLQGLLTVCENMVEHIEERGNGCQEQLDRLEVEVMHSTRLSDSLRVNTRRVLAMEQEVQGIRDFLEEAEMNVLNCKQCPNCGVATQKNGGCDHMVSC
jgi:hypothetical protein